MDSAKDSPEKPKPKPKLENITLVVVPGLRDDDDDVQLRYPWDKHWLHRMEVFRKPIMFESGLSLRSNDRDILSPEWFELAAKRLLQEVKEKREKDDQLVFFGESLGGIILKRALTLAETTEEYAEISRDVCACVLLGVPHGVPFVEAWKQVVVEVVIPFWRSLPSRFWASTTALPEWLNSVSSEFVRIAFGFDIVTVYQNDPDYDDEFRVCDVYKDVHKIDAKSSPVLYLPHERLLERSPDLKRVAKFGNSSEAEVKVIFQHLMRAAEILPQSREYMRRLSHLCPFIPIAELGNTRGIIQHIQSRLNREGVSAVVLCGSRGIGKSTCSYHIYKNLLSQRDPSARVTYFAFDARDHRRRSVFSMLVKIIQQLLACQPDLVPSIQDALSNDDKNIRWTEGNLWIQLRFIIRHSDCKSIKLVVDSVSDCDAENLKEFLRNLFELQFAAPSRLKIVSTAAIDTPVPDLSFIQRLNIADIKEFQEVRTAFRGQLADSLVLENPKLQASRAKVKECLTQSEGLLHSILIAHRIRGIDSASSPACIDSELARLKTDWKHTITGMVSHDPPWLARAVSWMLFARRPLKSSELAVAMALEDWSVTPSLGAEFDEQVISRDIKGDLRRHLGRLVSIEREEIQISHPYAAEVFQEWLDDPERKSKSNKTTQTKRLMEYFRQCVKIMTDRDWKVIPDELGFKFFSYAQEQWHVHYREVMDDVFRPFDPSGAELELEELALSLFGSLEYRHWLQPANPFGLKSQSPDHGVDVTPNGMELAAQFGLFPVVLYLMNEDDKSDRIKALQIASQYGHRRIVQHLIDRIDDIEVIKLELTRACQRSDEAVVIVLLKQYKKMVGDADIPPSLLPEVCRIGHKALAEKLIDDLGAKIDGTDIDGIPLHEAVDQGHGDVVDLLLNKQANAMALYPDDSTPLMHSVQRGYRHISTRLLEIVEIRDTADNNGTTALHLAAHKGDVELMKLILQRAPYKESAKKQKILESDPEMRPNDQGTKSEESAAGLEGSRMESKGSQVESGEADVKEESGLKDEQLDVRSQGPETGNAETNVKKQNSPLHEAAANGHVEAVKLLLKNEFCKFDINEKDAGDRSPLFLALRNNHEKVVSYLFENGAEITFGKVYSESALRQVIIHGNLYATKKLLDRKDLDLNDYDARDASPLTDAIELDHAEIVRALWEAGADLSWKVHREMKEDILGEQIGGEWSVLHFAAYYGSVEVMKLLMSLDEIRYYAGDTTELGQTALHLAVAKGHMDIVDLMLPGAREIVGANKKLNSNPSRAERERKGSITVASSNTGPSTPLSGSRVATEIYFDLNVQTRSGLTALHIASANGEVETAKMLMVSRASVNIVNEEGKGALHFAAASHNNAAEIVKVLLGRCDPQLSDADGRTALHYAAERSNESVALLLLRNGASPNTASHSGHVPLYLAAKAGSAKFVRILIEHGADVNARVGSEWSTALHVAAYGGDLEMAAVLVMTGADVNVADNRYDTPLHEAVRRGRVKVVLFLLESGANVNAVNTRHITPLQRAVLNQWTKTVKVLLDFGANPNIRDEDGDTALTAALYSGQNQSVVKLLLEHSDADPDVINGNGKTPLMLALRYPSAYLQPLIDAGADVAHCGEDQITVLHRAAAELDSGDVDSVTPLLVRGEKYLDLKDIAGLAPLHYAAKYGRIHMIKELRKRGAPINAQDGQGRTPMHHAVRVMPPADFQEAFADFLCPNEGNDVNIGDADGWTPLHWACQSGNLEIVNLLLDKCGTDEARRKMILHRGERGWTALAIAEFHCRKNIKKALADALKVIVTKNRRDSVELAISALGNSVAPSEVTPDDIRAVEPGIPNSWVQCDDCLIFPLHGLRYRCKSHFDFDLCFKCYWHYKETHFPRGHEFDCSGEGPAEGPQFLVPPQNPAPPPAPDPTKNQGTIETLSSGASDAASTSGNVSASVNATIEVAKTALQAEIVRLERELRARIELRERELRERELRLTVELSNNANVQSDVERVLSDQIGEVENSRVRSRRRERQLRRYL